MEKPYEPSKEEIAAAAGKAIPDVIAPELRLLLSGINPSLYSAAVGHHFARPGNRFWPALYRAGLTPRLFSPFEDQLLLDYGIGITNLAARATARADELTTEELQQGMALLREKVSRYRPACIVFLGVTAYRTAFSKPKAAMGCQEAAIADAIVFVMPNPSGLNAHYQLDDFVEWFQKALQASSTSKADRVKQRKDRDNG